MPLIATKGAASAQGFGEFAQSAAPVYIEDVMSVYLYTGNGSTQTITNGIDLSTNGGLVWIKGRSVAYSHAVFDTARGATNRLVTNATDANSVETGTLTAFNSTGFALGSTGAVNNNGTTFASWTFRKQPKFFDVVTYTGNGTQGRSVSHGLGSAPGWMVVKRTDGVDNWRVYHRSLGGTKFLSLDTTAAAGTANTLWNDADPTSTVFYLGNDASVNGNGMSYVAYLFAHNAGGFGLTGADNVISCGSFTTDGSGNATVSLGYEPQWVLIKCTSVAEEWRLFDNMRGWTNGAFANNLSPNSSAAESNYSDTTYQMSPNATGFGSTSGWFGASSTYIYIAIRRGPMKTPTSGTSVFSPISATTVSGVQTTGFPVDTQFARKKAITYSGSFQVMDRLRGVQTTTGAVSIPVLQTASTAAETTQPYTNSWSNTGFTSPGEFGGAGDAPVFYSFRRAPGFFDEVCYTGGTGTPRVLNHNLAVAPELLITRIRNFTGEDWVVHYNNGSSIIGGYLNNTSAFANSSTAPSTDVTSFTATTYTLNTSNRRVNGAYNYVAYLFATVAGVSKVGSYTGTGTTLQVNCGFTGGARFVLIKRTDSTGDWYVWDSARGIVAGNDPYLLLNSTAAEVTGTDYVDTLNAGFEISSTAPAAINANGGTFIFLAIA